MRALGLAGIAALAIVLCAGGADAAGRTCRLDVSISSTSIAGLQVDGTWSLTEVRDHPRNPAHEYVGLLVDGAGQAHRVPDSPDGPSIKGQGLVWTAKDKWDCRPEAAWRQDAQRKAALERAAAMTAARATLRGEDAANSKLARCSSDARALIGLSRDRLVQACGFWASETTTVTTAAGRIEIVTYRYSYERRPALHVHLQDGIVTAVQGR